MECQWLMLYVFLVSPQMRYEVPKQMGIFRVMPSVSPDMSARNIIHRIVDKRAAFEARNAKKVRQRESVWGRGCGCVMGGEGQATT